MPAKRLFWVALILIALPWCRRAGHSDDGEPLGAPTPARALAGLTRDRPIAVRLETSEGALHCELDAGRAPNSVALFIGLATGRASFRDPRSGAVTTQPMYRNLSFFRAVPDVLVQSGCPLGNGTGSPGYRIAVETSPNDATRLDQPGVLLLAHYHPPPNRADPAPPPPGLVIGSQFVIGLGSLSHLAGQVSVLGSCSDLDRVRSISRLVAAHERSVTLQRVAVSGVND